MRREIRVRTPENVEFGFRLAGVASRSAAAIVDYLLLGLLVGALAAGFSLLGLFLGMTMPALHGWASSGVIAALVLSIFLVVFGYFLFFELTWNGQSPGKRAFGLRVVKDMGQGISFADSLVRNLVRMADVVPGLYGVGLLSMLLSGRNKRLGDYAAGTLVVMAERRTTPRLLPERWEEFNSLAEDSALVRRLLAEVTPEEVELARDSWTRRESLAPPQRLELMARVAGHFRERLGLPALRFVSDEQLVRDILAVVLRGGR